MKREVEVEVRGGRGGCRQELTDAIDIALSMEGARISRGVYRVTIERLGALVEDDGKAVDE